MQLIKLYISLLSIALTFSACEKTIDFTGNIPEPLIVMNCILIPDSTIKVELTKTRFFLSSDEDFTKIENATVTIRVNDGEPQLIAHSANGIYTFNIVCAPNDHIRIEVSAPELGSIWAEETVQNPIQIISVDTSWMRITDPNVYVSGSYYSYNGYDYNTIYNETYDTIIGERYPAELTIRIRFQEPISTKDFYRMNAFIKEIQSSNYRDSQTQTITDSILTDTYYDYYSIEYTDPVFGNDSQATSGIFDLSSGFSIQNAFSDELINGKDYFLTLKANRYRAVYFEDKNIPSDKALKNSLILHLQHLTASHYYYFKTVEAAGGTNTFSEPVQIYTNVNGGLGILGSYTTDMDTIYFD